MVTATEYFNKFPTTSKLTGIQVPSLTRKLDFSNVESKRHFTSEGQATLKRPMYGSKQ